MAKPPATPPPSEASPAAPKVKWRSGTRYTEQEREEMGYAKMTWRTTTDAMVDLLALQDLLGEKSRGVTLERAVKIALAEARAGRVKK